MLGPVLEKLAKEYQASSCLAKVDTDTQSRAGPSIWRAVDPGGLCGSRRQGGRRFRWGSARVGDPNVDRPALAHASRDARRRGPCVGAIRPDKPPTEKYKAALADRPRAARAQTGLARIALDQGRFEEAQARIQELERHGFLEPDAEKIKAELMLRLQAGEVGDVEAARAALAAKPDDANLKFQLAEALAAAGQYADALALCLELVERDRKGIGEKARQTMVAIFQLLPADSALVTEYQRQLSFVLMD